MAKDKMSAEEEEQEEIGLAGILPSILGGAAAIGGMIPSLLQGPQQRQLQAIQRGSGAGASLARQTASDAASRVVGATTTSGSRGRGGSLREGLRGAERIVEQGGRTAAVVGAQEGLRATDMLRQNDLIRRQAFRTLGAGGGQMLAGIGGMLAAARDQGEGQAGDAEDTLPGESAMQEQATQAVLPLVQGQNRITGLEQPSTATGRSQEIQEAGQAGLDRIQEARTGQVLRTSAPTGKFAQPGAIASVMGMARAPAPEPDTSGVAAQQAANVASLAQATAEKQESQAAYRKALDPRSEVRPSLTEPPSFTPSDPQSRMELEEYLYNQALNYIPALSTGLPPQEVALLLLEYGLPVDWQRLGVPQGGMSGE